MIRVSNPDPGWLVAFQSKSAVLWLGPDPDAAPKLSPDDLRALLLRPWAAVVVDGRLPSVQAFATASERVDGYVLRYFDEDAGSDRLPSNRLPIYALPPTGEAPKGRSVADARSLLVRLQMLQRIGTGKTVFALGVSSERGVAGLQEAHQIAGTFDALVVVADDCGTASGFEGLADSTYCWEAAPKQFVGFVEAAELGVASEFPPIAIRTKSGLQVVDISEFVDRSFPITAAFEWVPATAALGPAEPNAELLRQLIDDPKADWQPYAAGVAYPRLKEQERTFRTLLERYVDEGHGATSTAWLRAEEGSGASTGLRQLCIAAAQQGYPVMVAKPDAPRFDFHQLSTFMTRASEQFLEAGAHVSEVPWVVAFDAEHVLQHFEFINGLASGLGKLMRPVLVLAVDTQQSGADSALRRAAGANHQLGPALNNAISSEEAVRIGEHISRSLPPDARRAPAEWAAFAADAVRTSMAGSSSLFWVALRFWLFRLPGTGESFRSWLYARIRQAATSGTSLLTGMLETAAFSRYRLVMPADLLETDVRDSVRVLARDPGNSFGVRRVGMGILDGYVYAHPLIAEEILRIGASEADMLKAVDKQYCLGSFDLELHLLGRIISRPAVAASDNVGVVETLITSGLRVDPRDAPRNYEVRDRIVDLLEGAPDRLFDTSQVFNHQLAKARRHLAEVPPQNADWTLEARCEQLELAEYHLLDALERIRIDDPDRTESPLNLRVSLALTMNLRSRLESERGESAAAERYAQLAEENYAAAQRLDADNSYVLENFARFKIARARRQEDAELQATLLVEAITMLHWELQVLEEGIRDEPILAELARAYELLTDGLGHAMLKSMASSGSEAASVALARLALREDDGIESLAAAEVYLREVPVENRTWRSTVVLYLVVSRARPYDFGGRLQILEALDADPDFAWPLQLMLEHGILLYQAGDLQLRKKGRQVFIAVRDQLTERSATIRVPSELKFLADPATSYRTKLLTSMKVKNVSNVGRNFFGVPHGWYGLDVPFRPHLFGGDIRQGDDRDCYIQFTNFGPQAVPPTVG